MSEFEVDTEVFADDGNCFEIVDIKNPSVLAFEDSLKFEYACLNMTSLSSLLLISHRDYRQSQNRPNGDYDPYEDERRLTLAYERLQTIPRSLLNRFTTFVEMLDISNNEFSNLDFLSEFTHLTTLVCDHNNITSNTQIPYMPKLDLLWFNHCKISELYPWAKNLRQSCPNLRHLSLMGNPAAPSYLNGGTFYEYLQYRLFIISIFPRLVHLDDCAVTEQQRAEAFRTYRSPSFLERLASQHHLPPYLRSVTDRVLNVFQPAINYPFAEREKNIIV